MLKCIQTTEVAATKSYLKKEKRQKCFLGYGGLPLCKHVNFTSLSLRESGLHWTLSEQRSRAEFACFWLAWASWRAQPGRASPERWRERSFIMSLSLTAASLTRSRPGADIAVSNAKVSWQNIELKHLAWHLMERKTMFYWKGVCICICHWGLQGLLSRAHGLQWVLTSPDLWVRAKPATSPASWSLRNTSQLPQGLAKSLPCKENSCFSAHVRRMRWVLKYRQRRSCFYPHFSSCLSGKARWIRDCSVQITGCIAAV